jgi:hypothetical protein
MTISHSRYGRLLDVLAILFVLWIFAWSLAKIQESPQPAPIFGERWGITSYSDFSTLMAGERFYKDGFSSHYFLPNISTGYPEFSLGRAHYPNPEISSTSTIYDVSVGPLPAITNGLLRHLGVTDLLAFYKIAAFSSTIALLFWYTFAALLFGRIIALLSLLYIGTSTVFLHLTESLGGYAYGFFLAFGAGLAFLLAERVLSEQRWRTLAYTAAWLFTFLQSVNSLGFLIWLQVFFLGYLWIHHGRPFKAWRSLLFLTSAPLIGLSLHFTLVGWALGGFGNVVHALRSVLGIGTVGFPLEPFVGRWESKYLLGIDFVGIVVLLLLTLGIFMMLTKKLPKEMLDKLWTQWRLLVVFLVGGVAFVRMLSGGTAPIAEIPLRLLLPFIGLLLGYSIVIMIQYFKHGDRWQYQALAALIFLIPVMLSVVYTTRGADILGVQAQSHPTAYYGRSSDEVRTLAQFLKENTRHGDIVFTEINTGDPNYIRSHDITYSFHSYVPIKEPKYPHPAYEYLSSRSIEIAKDVPTLSQVLGEFEDVRQSLLPGNPASTVSFFVLTHDHGAKDAYRAFVACTGELQEILNTKKWLLKEWDVFNHKIPNLQFFLYKIYPARLAQCS